MNRKLKNSSAYSSFKIVQSLVKHPKFCGYGQAHYHNKQINIIPSKSKGNIHVFSPNNRNWIHWKYFKNIYKLNTEDVVEPRFNLPVAIFHLHVHICHKGIPE